MRQTTRALVADYLVHRIEVERPDLIELDQ